MSEIDKLEVRQNRVARISMNVPRYAAVKFLRGRGTFSTTRERITSPVTSRSR